MQLTVGVTPPKVEEGRDLPSRGGFFFPATFIYMECCWRDDVELFVLNKYIKE